MKKPELFENIEILQSIFDNSAAATIVTDFSGHIKMVNSEFENITGFSMTESEGTKKWIEKVVQEDLDTLDQYIKLVRANVDDQTAKMEIRFNDKAGNIKTGYLKGHALHDQRLIILSITDITEQKEYEKEIVAAKESAETSERLKTEFIANMSHEFRTPINAIVGFADLMKMEDLPVEKKELYLDQIIHGSHDLLLLIGKIVTISRLDSGQLKLSNRQFKINDRLKDLYNRFQEKIESRKLENIELSLDLGKDVESLSILGDPMRLNEVLINLIENALKFTEKGRIDFGYHFLKAEDEDELDSLLFFVKDTGTGVDKENTDIIFNRFVKILEKDETIFKGAGLGLAIVKEIVALFGGKVWLETKKGKGSSFYFTYPLKSVTVNKPKAQSPQKSEPSGLDWSEFEVLIAEDVESNYLLIKELLAPTGIKILRARDGMEALDLFMKNPSVAFVIMDILMPNMDGYEATKEIRNIKPDIPVVAQTAFSFEGDMEDGLYAGCFNDYIMKPYTRKILLGILSKYI